MVSQSLAIIDLGIGLSPVLYQVHLDPQEQITPAK